MIAGHFGFAALVKSRERRVPLWSLMLATAWLDILFVPLLLTNIETLETIPGAHGHYGTAIIHADLTHSLLGALVFSALFGLLFLPRWGRRSAGVLAFVAFSHWLLDLPMHRADMPLLPMNFGHLPRMGFGLWRSPVASATLEAALEVAGMLFYWRAAKEVADHAGRGQRRARLVSLLLLVVGLGILAMDVTS
jgi:membrane-bound metal-dependent hydrolase YbcI (DUF457 family)